MKACILKHSPDKSYKWAESYSRNEGFCDEAAISAMVNGGFYERTNVFPDEMALSSSEDDYAGWNLPKASSFREPSNVASASESPSLPFMKNQELPTKSGFLKTFCAPLQRVFGNS